MSIFGAIGSLVGGLFGAKSAEKQQQQLLQWQENAAKKQVRWRVADAKAAGVHPLTALGASLHSPSPVSVGNNTDYSSIGQNIGRAVDSTMSSDQKDSEFSRTAQALTLEKMELENNVIKQQLVNSAAATVNQAGNPPTFASTEMGEKPRRPDLPMGTLGVVPQSRRWAPAQDVEDEYSDIVSNAYGVAKWIRDYNLHTRPDRSHPLTKRYWQDRMRDYRNWRSNNHVRYRSRREKGVDYGYW